MAEALASLLGRLEIEGDVGVWRDVYKELGNVKDPDKINTEILLGKLNASCAFGDLPTCEACCLTAARLCAIDPHDSSSSLRIIRENLPLLEDPIAVCEIVTELTCSIPPLMKHLWGSTDSRSSDSLKEVISIKSLLEEHSIKHWDHTGFALRVARLMQVLVVCWSKRTKTDDEKYGEELSLNELSRDHPFIRHAVLREEGIKTLDKLISRVWWETTPTAVLLAVVNLLGHLALERPIFLSKIVPTLIDLYESVPAHLAPHQKLFLEHNLERQLAGLMENTAAEKFYSLVVEVLKKSSKFGKKRRPEDDEDDEALNQLAKKKTKPGETLSGDADVELDISMGMGIDANANVKIDVSKVPPVQATEIVLQVLINVDIDYFRESLERWRPMPARSARDPRQRDPRLAEVMGDSGDGYEDGNRDGEEKRSKSKKSDREKDEMQPFELLPRNMDQGDLLEAVSFQYKSLLSTITNFPLRSLHRKQGRLQVCIRLAALVSFLTPVEMRKTLGLPAQLLDYCFEDLGDRMPLLLYWLRLLWVQEDESVYRESYDLVISKLSQQIQEGRPGWEEYFQKILIDAPKLVGDFHLTVFQETLSNSSTRILGLAIVEQVLLKRPAVRQIFLHSLIEHCMAPDEAMRRSVVSLVCDGLSKTPTLYGPISYASTQSLHALECVPPLVDGQSQKPHCGTHLDFPLRLAFRRPEFVHELFSAYSNLPSHCQEYCMEQVAGLASLLGEAVKDFCQSLFQETIQNVPATAFLHKILEILDRFGSLGTVDLGPAFANVSSEKWPAATLEVLVLHARAEDLCVLLGKYLVAVDPGEESKKIIIATMFSRIVEKMGAAELFTFLHQQEGVVPLKRCIEATQICFSMTNVFRPDVLASSIQQLLDMAELPMLLMRSVIQSVTLYKGLSGFVIGILAKLISRKIWEMPKLWEGFIRSVKILAPASYTIILQLPAAQLESLLLASPDLRPNFIAYLSQQSSSVRSRYQHLL